MMFAAVVGHRSGRATPSLRGAPQRQSMEIVRRETIYRNRNAVQTNPATSHLATFQGVLQVDGYNGFKRLAGDRADASVRLAFCWSHMRRGFYDFHVSTKSPLAAEVLARIRTLYAIEAEIRSPAGRASTTRATRTKSADRGGPARVVGISSTARVRRIRSRPGHALRVATLVRTGGVPRRRPRRDRFEYR